MKCDHKLVKGNLEHPCNVFCKEAVCVGLSQWEWALRSLKVSNVDKENVEGKDGTLWRKMRVSLGCFDVGTRYPHIIKHHICTVGNTKKKEQPPYKQDR